MKHSIDFVVSGIARPDEQHVEDLLAEIYAQPEVDQMSHSAVRYQGSIGWVIARVEITAIDASATLKTIGHQAMIAGWSLLSFNINPLLQEVADA